MYNDEESFEDFEVVATPVATLYKAKVDDEFVLTRQFNTLVNVLEEASENDVVQIELTTIGGSLSAVLPLIHAMKHRKCHVHILAGDVASAGTFLLMLADSVEIIDGATIMFHEIQYGASSAGNKNIHTRVNYLDKLNLKFLKDMYSDFLTEEELDDLLKGVEVWMTSDEFMQRYYAEELVEGGGSTPPDEEPTIH